MKESDKMRHELEAAMHDAQVSATERGLDMIDEESQSKLKVLNSKIKGQEIIEESQRAMKFTTEAPKPVDEKAITDEVLGDFGHWISNKGYTRKGEFSPNYTLYVAHDMPESANVVRAFDPSTGRMDTRTLETDSTPGSATIPGKQFLSPVMARYEGNPMREIPGISIFSTPDGNRRTVPVMARPSTGTPLGVTSEDSASTELEPAITNVDFDAWVYRTRVQLTRELLADNAVGLQGLLPQFYTEVMESSLGRHFTTGDNSSKPQGVVTAAPSTGDYQYSIAASDKAGDADLTARSLGAFLRLMPRQYRRDAVIMMHQDTWNGIEFAYHILSQAASNGTRTPQPTSPVNLLSIDKITDRAPMLLNGYPVYLNNWMQPWLGADSSGNDNDKLIVMFVPQYYFIRDVQGIEFTYDPYSGLTNNREILHVVMRADGGWAGPSDGSIVTLRQNT